MALKSFILSKLDHQMSNNWKRIAAHELETTSKFDLLKNWVCTWLLSSGQDFSKKFIHSKHVLKVYLKPSRKNPKISFLPLCSKLVRLKILHLRDTYYNFWNTLDRIILCTFNTLWIGNSYYLCIPQHCTV